MDDFLAALPLSATNYAQKFDAVHDAVFFVSMSPVAYRDASFLDDRVLEPGVQGLWTRYADVEYAMRAAAEKAPLHFIFHTGHVGSTLLSRLIDETGIVLGLREPLPLRTLADIQDQLGTPAAFFNAEQLDVRLLTFLKLWRRGFKDVRKVVLKATSSSARLADRLLGASPSSKAIYLNLRAEPYLATMLAGANAMTDLGGFAGERMRRLESRYGLQASLKAQQSVGELAAMSWLAESLTRYTVGAAHGRRVMLLDFEQLLTNLEATMVAVLSHLEIEAPFGYLATIARSPLLSRYSKAPGEFEYSSLLRSQLLAQARGVHAGEIKKGLNYLDGLAKADPRVAALLGP